jgi:hypothetical protein
VAKPDITRLLIDSALQPELCRRLAETPDAVFEEYDLTAEQCELLRRPDRRLLPLLGAALEQGAAREQGAALERRAESPQPEIQFVQIAVDSRMLPDAQMALTVVPCLIGERISFAAWISPLAEGGDPSRLPPPAGSTLPGTPLAPLYAVIHLAAAQSNDANGDLRVNLWASFRQSSNAATAPPAPAAPECEAVRAAAEAARAAAPPDRYQKLAALVRAMRGGDPQ